MIYRASKEEIDEYFASPRVGQSKLKLIGKSLRLFLDSDERSATMYFEEKEHLVVGSAVDCILTGRPDDFNNLYHVSDVKKPSDTIMSIVNQIFDVQVALSEDGSVPNAMTLISDDNISASIESHSYYPKWKIETRIEKIRVEGGEYYKSLADALGKTVLGLDQYTTVSRVTQSIKNHHNFAWLFTEQQGIDVYFQKIIYFEYMGVEYKAMLDILIVDHIKKTIQVVDFKTMFDVTLNFPNSLKQRRYDIQGAWYSIAAFWWYTHECGFYDPVSRYVVRNPAFIVETTKPGNQGEPLFFECTDDLMGVAMYGMQSVSEYSGFDRLGKTTLRQIPNQKILGVNDLVIRHKWYIEHGFEKEKDIVESNGILQLGWGGIKHENSAW